MNEIKIAENIRIKVELDFILSWEEIKVDAEVYNQIVNEISEREKIGNYDAFTWYQENVKAVLG